jgi:hypothetical protein
MFFTAEATSAVREKSAYRKTYPRQTARYRAYIVRRHSWGVDAAIARHPSRQPSGETERPSYKGPVNSNKSGGAQHRDDDD